MILTETNQVFPLSSVKPLEGLKAYRSLCLELTKKALQNGSQPRTQSPVGKKPLEPYGKIEGLSYSKCPETGSLFLTDLTSDQTWAQALKEINQRRRSPSSFLSAVGGSRTENVYIPKLEWIESSLKIQSVKAPSVVEITTPASPFTSLLKSSGYLKNSQVLDEMDLVMGAVPQKHAFDAAILFESLDRVNKPEILIKEAQSLLKPGGFVFLTALVSSGFDFSILGTENLYLYPPDRTNCFSLSGLQRLLTQAGFSLIEVSTPGVLDVEIVRAHLNINPNLPLSSFDRRVVENGEVGMAFQTFLQQSGLSSYTRIIGRKE